MKAFYKVSYTCLLASISIASFSQSNVVPDQDEFDALKALWESTNGATEWLVKTNWPTAGSWPSSATAAQMATWYGVTVSNGDITQISLSGNRLTGSIPAAIGKLKKLSLLSLGTNRLSGSIPLEIGELTSLTNISVDTNLLTGPVPDQIVDLHNLQYLALNNNQLTSLPSDMTAMTALLQITANNNKLEGSLPELPINIGAVRLHLNQFTGSIPSSYTTLTKLAILHLYSNQLSGTIPSDLSNAVNMREFYLYNNQFTGPLPSSFIAFTKMQYLDVHGNQLSGEVPAIFSVMTQLISLNLADNHFKGTPPPLRGQSVDISSNGFTGTLLPVSGAPVTTILAANNGFTEVSSSISTLTSLLKLDVSRNELVTLPSAFQSHSNKANLLLYVQNNRLDFSILESYASGFKAGSILVPQKNIHDRSTVTITVGDSLIIPSRALGANTSITWEKQSGNSWSTVGSSRSYKKFPAVNADEGVYRWKATSTSFAGTTLQSDPIKVNTSIGFTLDNWAFQYQYDGRRRMTHKKVPGADWVYMVYDDRDRLVMTQDGNQRKIDQWTYTKYDALNRPIITGLYDHTSEVDQPGMDSLISKSIFFESLDTTANLGYTNTVFDPSDLPGTFQPLTITYYDNYDFLRGDTFFSYKTGELPLQNTESSVAVRGSVTGTWTSTLGKDKQWIRTVNYYDDKQRLIQSVSEDHRRSKDILTTTYDFVNKPTATKTTSVDHRVLWTNVHGWAYPYEDRIVSTNTGSLYAYSSQEVAANTDGWVEFTCSAGGVNTDKSFGFSANTPANPDFCVRQRVTISPLANTVQVYESGAGRGSAVAVQAGDVIRIERKGLKIYYSRNGIVFYTKVIATRPALHAHLTLALVKSELYNPKISVDGTTKTIERSFQYDHAGRLINTYHSLDDADSVLLSHQEYNELGQLIDKKLHTDRQSIDYRYNIRGWLTSINGADLPSTGKNEDLSTERKDLFGMDLLYNEKNVQLDNDQLYNGNISSMRWSNNLGLGEVKERAYRFSYDPMNRLTDATQKTYGVSWTSSSAYHEAGVTYDLNGNILTLDRTTDNGQLMDQLNYRYGEGNEEDNRSSNQLLAVSDSSLSNNGFKDGNNAGDDYAYDSNGNMIVDKNKDITSIAYNHLNLPEKVTKSNGDYITYTYDATGRKLIQDVYSADVLSRRSNYHNEWFYENDTLRFVNHEEGRAVAEGNWTDSPQLLPDPQMTNAANFSALRTTIASQTISGQTYLAVTGTSSTVNTIGGFVTTDQRVNPGKMYTVRVKGYRAGMTYRAFLYVEGVGQITATPLVERGVELLGYDAASEQWTEMTFSVPATVNRLRIGFRWSSGVPIGTVFYINDMELYEYNGIHGNQVFAQDGYTYQYHLKDHLGNVRMTFTTKDEKEESTADFETATSDFLYYEEAVKINSEIFDHTGSGPTYYSTRLNGSPTERYGVARSLSVMPGDTVNVQVFAKYLDPDSASWTVPFADFLESVSNSTAPAGTFVDGGVLGSTGGVLFPFWTLFATEPEDDNEDAPKAYLNWLIFDKDYNLKDGGALQVSTAAAEHGQDGDHEELSKQLLIGEPGYVYVYLSNDNYALEGEKVEVFFDDFKVEHVKSPVVQSEDYYPFGLTFNSYSRENSVANQYKFQGQEHQDELDLGWDAFKWRNHQPEIGRFFNIDKLAEKYYYNSPYAFSENKVVAHRELEGLESDPVNKEDKGPTTNLQPSAATQQKFAEAKSQLMNAFKGSISLEGKFLGASAKGQIGPLKAEGGVALATSKVQPTSNGVDLKLSVGTAEGKIGLASAEAKANVALAEITTSITPDDVTFTSKELPRGASASLGKNGFEMTAENSTTIGVGGSVSAVKAEGSVNVWGVISGIGNLLGAGVSYVGDLIQNNK